MDFCNPQLVSYWILSLFFHAGAIVVPNQKSHIRSEFTYPAKERFLQMRGVSRSQTNRQKENTT